MNSTEEAIARLLSATIFFGVSFFFWKLITRKKRKKELMYCVACHMMVTPYTRLKIVWEKFDKGITTEHRCPNCKQHHVI